jgi:murein DD-endopeptidase MepM/ murein hydrolase activator NlpD
LKIKYKIILILLTLGMTESSFASLPTFYYDNQDGFVDASNCSITQIESQRFRISSYSGKDSSSELENLRNYKGIKQSNLINGSLVKLIEGKEKRDFKKVEVVGINQGKNLTRNRWFSERLDQGYLYYRSLLPAEDYVLKLVKGTQSYRLGDLKNSAEELYLQIAVETNFFKLNCQNFGNREYVIFKAYEKFGSEPIALIGMYWDESKIFKHIESMTKYEAIEILPNILEEESMESYIGNDSFNSQLDDSSEVTIENDVNQNMTNIELGIDNIVCVSKQTLNVRDKSLEKNLFRANLGEKIKIFQGWGENTIKRKINGTVYNFNKVQLSNREEEDQMIGWVATAFIKPRGKCKYLESSVSDEFVSQMVDTTVTGLNDPNCCEFPTVKRPTHRYDSGMRKFGAGRSEGRRLHAACDLYRFKDEPILSVAPGKIIRDRYYFYQGTYALEVKHSGGFVVRYGELDKKGIAGMSKGKILKMGQRIGHMGKVNSNCCRPMLHFELFEGSKPGSLSQSSTRYKRRSDLMDPTTYLHNWENENF